MILYSLFLPGVSLAQQLETGANSQFSGSRVLRRLQYPLKPSQKPSNGHTVIFYTKK